MQGDFYAIVRQLALLVAEDYALHPSEITVICVPKKVQTIYQSSGSTTLVR